MLTKEKVLLKDEVVKKIFTSGSKASKEYILNIISEIIKVPVKKLKEDFELVTSEVSVNTNIINNEADVIFQNKDCYFSIEFNYNNYEGLSKKNYSYLCQLYLRDVIHKEDYKKIKQIWQFSFDNFDYFKENRFIYVSEMMEQVSHKSRNIGMYIVDINLDYLEKKDYNSIRKGSTLEKLLYIFVCDNEEVLNQIYEGNDIMEELRKEMQVLRDNFDALLYYDKKKLDREMGEWVGKRSVIKEMLKENYSKKEIKKICKLDDKDFSEMLEEIEKGW